MQAKQAWNDPDPTGMVHAAKWIKKGCHAVNGQRTKLVSKNLVFN